MAEAPGWPTKKTTIYLPPRKPLQHLSPPPTNIFQITWIDPSVCLSVCICLSLCVCCVCVFYYVQPEISIRPDGKFRRTEPESSDTWSFGRVWTETTFSAWRWLVAKRRRPAVVSPISRKSNETRSPTWRVIWSQVNQSHRPPINHHNSFFIWTRGQSIDEWWTSHWTFIII